MSDADIVKDFLIESYENLDRLDRDLVELEKNPEDRNALAGIFRTIHTIKGTCGFLGFGKLEKVAHVGENLLSRLRDGQLTLNPEITTALLSMVDAVRQMLKAIELTGNDGEIDYPELRDNLTRLLQPQNPAEKSSTSANLKEKKEGPLNSKAAKENSVEAEPRKTSLPEEFNIGLPSEEKKSAFRRPDEAEPQRSQQPAASQASASESTIRAARESPGRRGLSRQGEADYRHGHGYKGVVFAERRRARPGQRF